MSTKIGVFTAQNEVSKGVRGDLQSLKHVSLSSNSRRTIFAEYDVEYDSSRLKSQTIESVSLESSVRRCTQTRVITSYIMLHVITIVFDTYTLNIV